MSVTEVAGFEAAGIHCGIKAEGVADLALIKSQVGPCPAAGVFTSNKLTAAPVLVTQRHLAHSRIASAVIINSGNANAATGAQGMADAERMCQLTAEAVGCAVEQVLVCSTGLIGFEMPMDVVEQGIPKAAAACTPDGGALAAKAMMTTDTMPKLSFVAVGAEPGPGQSASKRGSGAKTGFAVGGIAKGAAMLQPDMATMLAILTTDAKASVEMLQTALSQAVAASFNCLTVDGAQSTNDTVLLLSSGLGAEPTSQAQLTQAVSQVCFELAKQMADDAEGSTKTVTLKVIGAKSDAEAALAARRCANSQLIKCSWYGCDPYWGRLASECGASGIEFAAETLSISYGSFVVYENGQPQSPPAEHLAHYMAGRELEVTINLGQGSGSATILTNDLTPGYIAENMRTS